MNHRTEEVYLDFNRTQIHPNTIGMLKGICPEEDIQQSLTNIQNKRGLHQKKAQQLCIRLLQLMAKNDWEREDEIIDNSQNEHNQGDTENEVHENSNADDWEDNQATRPVQNQVPSQDSTLSQMIRGEQNSGDNQV